MQKFYQQVACIYSIVETQLQLSIHMDRAKWTFLNRHFGVESISHSTYNLFLIYFMNSLGHMGLQVTVPDFYKTCEARCCHGVAPL